VTTGPGDNAAAAAGRGYGHLRASHAEREQVISTLKEAFVEGRLTAAELDTRVDQVFASRTYAELAKVTVDIPASRPRARPARDPWRATKSAWLVVYAVILPGLMTLAALPGGPAPTTGREVATYTAVTYAVFWLLGGSVMVASRLGKRSSGRQLPARPGNGTAAAVGAGGEDYLPLYRARATSTFKAALRQGLLTEDEYAERMGQAAAAGSRTELAVLVVDLPVGGMDAPARPPTSKDVRVGLGVTIAAAGVVGAILLTGPDNALAFMTFILAAVTLLVAPIVTVGMKVDARRRKRSGGPLPLA
jgi:energy-converting hydrogenase Eha subunit E